MTETPTREVILGELSLTIGSFNLEHLKEDIDDLGSSGDVDLGEASTIRDNIINAIEKLSASLELAEGVFGEKPGIKEARAIERVRALLSDVDGLPALLKEVELLIPPVVTSEEDTVSKKEQDDQRFAELLAGVNNAKDLDEMRDAQVDFMIFVKIMLDEKLPGGEPVDTAEPTIAESADTDLSDREKRRKEARRKLGLENFEERDERLTRAAEEASEGRSGIKIARLWERVKDVPLSVINIEIKKKVEERRAVDKVLGESLGTIKTELSLRNTFDDLAVSKDGLVGLESAGHKKDILALAKFLDKVGLINGYDADGLGEEGVMKIKRYEGDVNRFVDKLTERYEEADEPHEKAFKAYVERQASFFAAVLGGKAINPEAAPTETPVEAPVEPPAEEAVEPPAEEAAPDKLDIS